MASPAAVDRGFDSAIKGLRTIVGIIDTPIDLVDDAPLCWGGKGRHREIGVATEIAQQGYLPVQPTPFAIRARVVQGPIAVDKTEDGSPILLAKKAVVVREAAAKFSHFLNEGVALLVVVVQMHFHVANAETHHLRYAFEQIAPVFFLRIEEAVLCALA